MVLSCVFQIAQNDLQLASIIKNHSQANTIKGKYHLFKGQELVIILIRYDLEIKTIIQRESKAYSVIFS